MLSPAQVVAVRRLHEKMYDGKCTVIEYQKKKKADQSTGFEEIEVLKDQPCRLSFSTSESANSGAAATGIGQVIKLFLSPDVAIKAGSKIMVTQNGIREAYKNSGVPAVYATHQEIVLELFTRWA